MVQISCMLTPSDTEKANLATIHVGNWCYLWTHFTVNWIVISFFTTSAPVYNRMRISSELRWSHVALKRWTLAKKNSQSAAPTTLSIYSFSTEKGQVLTLIKRSGCLPRQSIFYLFWCIFLKDYIFFSSLCIGLLVAEVSVSSLGIYFVCIYHTYKYNSALLRSAAIELSIHPFEMRLTDSAIGWTHTLNRKVKFARERSRNPKRSTL